jgi:NADH:ubiquinone oxidoreductase subunit F (NADH-binding)
MQHLACSAYTLCAALQAYERGQYGESVKFLEKAVEQTGKASVLGGEAMMWLALAYQVGWAAAATGFWVVVCGSAC